MTDCAMFNITMGEYHPSTICIEMSKLKDSLSGLIEVTKSEYPEESMAEYIQEFARTDEIQPTDRTLGFVVLNKAKKVVSLSFSEMNGDTRKGVEQALEEYRKAGFQVELDLPS